MGTAVYNFNPGDWVTTIGDVGRPLLNQVFNNTATLGDRPVLDSRDNRKEDGIESVFVRAKKVPNKNSKEKEKKKGKKKKKSRRSRMAPPPPVSIIRRTNGDIERSFFIPYTTSYFQSNNLYKSNVLPKYLNGTVASELKRVAREYWPSTYYSPTPFVASCCTRNTHNVHLLKQETFAKIKAAILPFKSAELNDQSMNSLRSIKRSIEKYWKLYL